jgi:hypothetical protein
MKATIYFIFTCLISTGALLGALNAKNPFPAFIVAFGIWAVFLWGYSHRNKKRFEKNEMEQSFRNYIRTQHRKQNR